MKISFLKSFLTLGLLAILSVGCQKETVRETTVVGKNEARGGTDNTGGGNGVDGIPLDKFIYPVDKKESYKTFVIPLIEKLKTTFPRLAADFYHISQDRDWYFVPADLTEISSNILGTYAPTDQYALQDLNKIWIDSNKFDKMAVEDQGVLIVHEIMMGVRLLKYKERQDLCLAKAFLVILSGLDQATQEKLKGERRSCRDTYPVFDGTQNSKFSLAKEDYDLIRKLVSKLIQSDGDIDEVKALMEAFHYRDYKD